MSNSIQSPRGKFILPNNAEDTWLFRVIFE